MSDKRAIGVFDSGIGGITTLDKIYDLLPNEDYIYVGDTLNCPYGTRPKEEIEALVTNVANFLLKRDVKAIVIACNTATANSAHLKKLTNIPIIGVINPTADYAYKMSKNKNILVLATNATIDSNKYKERIERRLFKKGTRYYVKASEFVPVCEAQQMGTDYAMEVVSDKLKDLRDKNIDLVVCGCTHFGLLEKEIKANIPNANLIECGIPTGEYLKKVLNKKGLSNDSKEKGKITIYTTGDSEYVDSQIKWFTKEHENTKKIVL